MYDKVSYDNESKILHKLNQTYTTATGQGKSDIEMPYHHMVTKQLKSVNCIRYEASFSSRNLEAKIYVQEETLDFSLILTEFLKFWISDYDLMLECIFFSTNNMSCSLRPN